MCGTYWVLVMVHSLSQDRAEGHGGQCPGLLPHGSDLQQGSERWKDEDQVTLYTQDLFYQVYFWLCFSSSITQKDVQNHSIENNVMLLLTQSADGTVVGLVTQCVGAGVAQTQVSAGQDERVSQVRQTDDTLIAVVTVLVIWRLEEQQETYKTHATEIKHGSTFTA